MRRSILAEELSATRFALRDLASWLEQQAPPQVQNARWEAVPIHLVLPKGRMATVLRNAADIELNTRTVLGLHQYFNQSDYLYSSEIPVERLRDWRLDTAVVDLVGGSTSSMGFRTDWKLDINWPDVLAGFLLSFLVPSSAPEATIQLRQDIVFQPPTAVATASEASRVAPPVPAAMRECLRPVTARGALVEFVARPDGTMECRVIIPQ